MRTSGLCVLFLSAVGPLAYASLLPSCSTFYANISATANNVNQTMSSTIQDAGTYQLFFQYCEPARGAFSVSRPKPLLLCHHGVTYNHQYWDIQYQPETYSFVRRATSEGYPVLIYDELGAGKSVHPDPLNVVQLPMHVAPAAKITQWAKDGGIHAASHSFEKVVHVGHSFGSAIVHGLLHLHSDIIDAAVLSGFGTTGPTPQQIANIATLAPPAQVDPSKWGNLDPNYLTFLTEAMRAGLFYHNKPNIAFDPKALDWDYTHGDTITVGDLTTNLTYAVVAPSYRGPLFIVNGEYDFTDCPPPANSTSVVGDCGYGATSIPAEQKPFFPNSKFHYDIIPNTGHSINFHFAALQLYAKIFSWLSAEGF